MTNWEYMGWHVSGMCAFPGFGRIDANDGPSIPKRKKSTLKYPFLHLNNRESTLAVPNIIIGTAHWPSISQSWAVSVVVFPK